MSMHQTCNVVLSSFTFSLCCLLALIEYVIYISTSPFTYTFLPFSSHIPQKKTLLICHYGTYHSLFRQPFVSNSVCIFSLAFLSHFHVFLASVGSNKLVIHSFILPSLLFFTHLYPFEFILTEIIFSIDHFS